MNHKIALNLRCYQGSRTEVMGRVPNIALCDIYILKNFLTATAKKSLLTAIVFIKSVKSSSVNTNFVL